MSVHFFCRLITQQIKLLIMKPLNYWLILDTRLAGLEPIGGRGQLRLPRGGSRILC